MTARANSVLFLGGNGHARERIAPAAALAETHGFSLVDVPYPGFEERPRSPSFPAFLSAVADFMGPRVEQGARVYATGIGGLILMKLRADERLLPTPTILQGAVLWGLERRWFPRLLGKGPLPRLVKWLLQRKAMQRRFVRKQFRRPPTSATTGSFFDGYARCPAFADFFRWLRPALLRELEQDLRAAPERLDEITFWWGAHDAVVTREELRLTEQALRHTFPQEVFPDWGHYPMIDDPARWVESLHEFVATSERVS